jgi:DNA-binding transcriptional ArsR family regulator
LTAYGHVLKLRHARPVGARVGARSVSQPAVSKHLRVLREAGIVAASADTQ